MQCIGHAAQHLRLLALLRNLCTNANRLCGRARGRKGRGDEDGIHLVDGESVLLLC